MEPDRLTDGATSAILRRVPSGRATPWLHEQLKVGDRLRFSGPFGRFLLRKSDPRPLLFLAGGSGLSSPRSMILDRLETDGDTRPITLVYGARNGAELYVHAAAEALYQGDFRGQRAWLYGPPPLIEACIRTPMKGRLFERDIFTERFVTAGDAERARSPLFRSL